MDAVICCIAKDEELYIQEWIEYHLKLGFDRVYIYDNSNDHVLESLIKTYQNRIHVTHFPGKIQQMNAYRHFLKTFGSKHGWVAFIDVDEFIVLHKHADIHTYLEEKCPTGSVALNWLYFGTNGFETYEDRPVLERFTRCSETVAAYVKVIARIQDIESMPEPHYVKLRNDTFQKFMDGRQCKGASMYTPGCPPNQLCAVIHHYFTKSRQEFDKKNARGRACDTLRYDAKMFARCDLNEVENTDALDFFRSRTLPTLG